MKKREKIKRLLFFAILFFGLYFKTLSVRAYTIYDSPYVTFSPDGQAWTTDAGRQDVVWYRDDGSDDVITGVVPSLRRPGRGEHYYSVRRIGNIPVARWRVELAKVNCCHHDYPSDGQYHGIPFATQICLRPHFSAWRPICADCGNIIVKNYFYMSREAAASIDQLKVGPDLYYYYLCPFNGNLEQGVGLSWHKCKSISYNRYRVEYMPNTEGALYAGSMQASFHMYENATEYEGQEVTPQTRLNPNGYKRNGWVFLGWNTEADGSGNFYENEAEILNLCEEEYRPGENMGTVKLYAMWKKASGRLSIMLIGSSYYGKMGMYTVTVPYGDKYDIDINKLSGGKGFYVAFVSNGAGSIPKINTVRKFVDWRPYNGQVLKGRLRENTYYFSGEDGDWDRIEPVFEQPEVTLPAPNKENYSFGGWYYDREFTQFAGYGGDKVVPEKDTYLYARWVELKLESQIDPEVYGGTGAVDLRWSQEDSRTKIYQLYQSGDGRDWQQVFCGDDCWIEAPVEIIYRSDDFESVYEVPVDGFYHLEAYGERGQDYGDSRGGYGGKTEGFFYLKKGEKLYFYSQVQQENSANNGGVIYGNGGQFAAVESDRQGLLLLAGGGGGAGPGADGGAGGVNVSLEPISVAQRYGENGKIGVSGGGGGFRGGNAGKVLVHNHTEGVCNHVHQGEPDQQGGCYTLPIKCGKKLKHILTKVEHWYWAGTDTTYCPACGADATKGETCSGHDTYYYKHVCPEHGARSNNNSEDQPKTCGKIVSYDLGCGLTTEYTCGYTAGQVLFTWPSGGGSNYVNADLVGAYGSETGVNAGSAWIKICYEPELFSEKTELEDLQATDLQAPAIIDENTLRKLPSGAESINVCWEEPEDEGSIYYHQAKSFDPTSGELISNSNITRDVLVSGVVGYYYTIDESENTQCDKEKFQYTEGRQLQIHLTDRERYLHLAAADRTGNVGETIHVRIQSRKNEDGEIKWPVYTKPLRIEEEDTVYQRNLTEAYYVKCDGSTPFGLSYSAYMAGQPADNYQLNQCIFENIENDLIIGRNIVRVPEREVSQERVVFQTQALKYEADDDPILQIGSYAEASRQNGSRELTLRQKFILGSECDGRKFLIIPVAGACTEELSVFSDHALDEQNGLEIIGDGTAPVISGLDIMEEYSLLDRREGDVELVVTAEDRLSGVKEFYLEIDNLDNGSYVKVYPDESGAIRINITEDLPEFSGDFTLSVYAEDHVGNAVTEEYRTTEFDLWADIERVLAPHEPQLKKGESGVLKIASWGYADRVEVYFPDEFADDKSFDHVYTYELNPSYRQDEELEFVVPLYVPGERDYTVTVRAYKGDRMLEVHPRFAVMSITGSVLDDVRTRLR